MSCCVWNEFSIAIVQFNECRQHASSWLWKVLRFNDGPQNASLRFGVISVALVLVAVGLFFHVMFYHLNLLLNLVFLLQTPLRCLHHLKFT